ncbi:UDP-N-acetylmuramoyl-tripeptide--D-alanyl-D-alanine ligase [hydrothermal vent metagenome]|uniref:UDP-MurNAc-pentapeptide synthetase n=1 Tax=hydrothermal vent metagenome TaxID=652676 RepID=A0A3B0TZF1_9ZZZZ
MSALFSIAELLAATGGRAENISADHISGVSIDSRALKARALFVAIRGERFDGHRFVGAAIKNGAVAALVSEENAPKLAGLPLIIVPDTLMGLVDIAKAARKRSRAKIVAITGSAGKTTTKEMVAGILERAGPTHASVKSYNNHWGVPLMVANLAEAAKFAVFEIGMNHPCEITPLAKLVRPDLALVTNVGVAHIGNFANIDEIAEAKAEIFSGLEPGGVAILNADHAQLAILVTAAKARRARVITYGFAADADMRIKNYHGDENGSSAQIVSGDEKIEIGLVAAGSHMMANAAGALAVATQLGVARATSLAALAAFAAPAGRGQTVRLGPEKNPLLLIDESYNANPSSMRAALAVFADIAPPVGGGQKIMVVGDMLELGQQSQKLHEALCADLRLAGADKIFLAGPYMRRLAGLLEGEIAIGAMAETGEEIKDAVMESLAYGDAVMVKGSKGVGLGKVVLAIRERFAAGQVS